MRSGCRFLARHAVGSCNRDRQSTAVGQSGGGGGGGGVTRRQIENSSRTRISSNVEDERESHHATKGENARALLRQKLLGESITQGPIGWSLQVRLLRCKRKRPTQATDEINRKKTNESNRRSPTSFSTRPNRQQCFRGRMCTPPTGRRVRAFDNT